MILLRSEKGFGVDFQFFCASKLVLEQMGKFFSYKNQFLWMQSDSNVPRIQLIPVSAKISVNPNARIVLLRN